MTADTRPKSHTSAVISINYARSFPLRLEQRLYQDGYYLRHAVLSYMVAQVVSLDGSGNSCPSTKR